MQLSFLDRLFHLSDRGKVCSITRGISVKREEDLQYSQRLLAAVIICWRSCAEMVTAVRLIPVAGEFYALYSARLLMHRLFVTLAYLLFASSRLTLFDLRQISSQSGFSLRVVHDCHIDSH
jgi:hypothetical protein